MVKLFSPKARKDTRKYPLRKDANGLSARKRSFSSFDEGKRPAKVARELDISLKTVCKYFGDWKKLPVNVDKTYTALKKSKVRNPKLMSEIAKRLSSLLSAPEEKILEELQKPWSLKRIVNGEFLEHAKQMELARLANAVKFLELYEVLGVPVERIKAALDELEKEALSHQQ